MRKLFLFLLLILCPALSEARGIEPQLVAEGSAPPGGEVELAIHMRPEAGWHGYWLNPGDAGLPMDVEWQLPNGFSAGSLRYPVPTRLKVAGLMNYVYERDYAVLVRLKVPADASGTVPIRAQAHWLACTDKICVPEQGELSLDLPVGKGAPNRAKFDTWRTKLAQPLATVVTLPPRVTAYRIAIPLPASARADEPYLFPITDDAVDYEAPQSFRRAGDWLVADLKMKKLPEKFSGVLALGDGRGLEFQAVPGNVPSGGTPINSMGWKVVLFAVLGAIAGGLLLNLMPCVFPILALKALHISRGRRRRARGARDALAYTAGAVVGTGALGAVLLAIRAAGADAGWAFQLQDPRTIMLLLLLAVAITPQPARVCSSCRCSAGSARPAGSFGTGALAAFVATPCAGPFLGAALGTALLLPPTGSVAGVRRAGPRPCHALPVAVAFVPALRGPPAQARPMDGRGCSASSRSRWRRPRSACLWLLYRQAGHRAAGRAGRSLRCLCLCLVGAGRLQRTWQWQAAIGRRLRWLVRSRRLPYRAMPQRGDRNAGRSGAEAWSEAAVAAIGAAGPPGVRLFHRRLVPDVQGQRGRGDRPRGACATRSARRASRCSSATGPTAIRRSRASSKAGAGPAFRSICGTRRAEPTGGTAADTDAGDAHRRAQRPALGARSQTFFPATQVSSTCVRASACGSTVLDVAVDEDEVGPFAGLEAADLLLGEAGIGRAAGEGGKRLLEAVSRSSGIQPPGGWPFMSWRLIAAARPGKGLGHFDREIGAEGKPRTRASATVCQA